MLLIRKWLLWLAWCDNRRQHSLLSRSLLRVQTIVNTSEIKVQFSKAADVIWAFEPILKIQGLTYMYHRWSTVYLGEIYVVSRTYIYSY